MPTDDNEDAADDDDDDDVDDVYFVLLGFIRSQSPPGLRPIKKLIWKQAGKPQCPSVLHTSVWMVVSAISQLDPHSGAPQVPHRAHDG